MPPQKVQKVMTQPINLIFRFLQNKSRIQVWLYENVNLRIEGVITGFDEYMNLVLDDAEEVHMKSDKRKQLGRIMLKGDNITLLQGLEHTESMWKLESWTVQIWMNVVCRPFGQRIWPSYYSGVLTLSISISSFKEVLLIYKNVCLIFFQRLLEIIPEFLGQIAMKNSATKNFK